MSVSKALLRNVGVAAPVLLIFLALPVRADFIGMTFKVDAVNATGAHSEYEITLTPPVQNPSEFSWSLSRPVSLVDAATHEVVGTLTSASVRYVGDPQINVAFSMQNGSSPAVFTVLPALLTFAPLTNPEARASAGINLTDFDGDGASLTAAPGSNGAFLAQYNGFVPNGTTFAEGINQINVVDPFGSASAAVEVPPGGGFTMIPGVVSDMSCRVSFTISPNDIASGTTNFEIVPEPATLCLAALAALLVRRR